MTSLKSITRIPHVIFGVGSYHYPTLRQSISLVALDKVASHLGLKWTDSREGAAQIAEGDGFLLVKPRTYQIKDNYKALDYVLKRYPGASVDHCTLVYHDQNIPVGTFQVGFAGKASDHEGLANGVRIFKTETFRKFGIGIGPLKNQKLNVLSWVIEEKDIDTYYNYNKMPAEHRNIIDKEVLSDLDYIVDCLLTRHKIVRSDKKSIEVSQIQQLLRQTVLRQKATFSEEELMGVALTKRTKEDGEEDEEDLSLDTVTELDEAEDK